MAKLATSISMRGKLEKIERDSTFLFENNSQKKFANQNRKSVEKKSDWLN